MQINRNILAIAARDVMLQFEAISLSRQLNTQSAVAYTIASLFIMGGQEIRVLLTSKCSYHGKAFCLLLFSGLSGPCSTGVPLKSDKSFLPILLDWSFLQSIFSMFSNLNRKRCRNFRVTKYCVQSDINDSAQRDGVYSPAPDRQTSAQAHSLSL